MAESQYPQQTRAIDPFASYSSNVVNELTRMVTGGSDLLFSPSPIDVTYDTTSPTQAVVVTVGGAFKDDVWIQITADHRVDFNKSFNYTNFDGGFNEEGYYYIVLEYTYVKSKPPPQAAIKIIKPSKRSSDFNASHLFLKVVEVENIGGTFTIVDLLGYDPENPNIFRQGTVTKTSIAPTLPVFNEEEDQGTILYTEDSDAFYFGGRDRWQSLFAENVRINVDTTGLEVGELIYINASGTASPARSDLISTVARAAVSTVGLTSDGSGTARIAGRVSVKIESAITITAGEAVYLSVIEEGTITSANNKPSPIYQYVGQALETGIGPAKIDIVFAPGPPTIDAPYDYRTTTGLSAGLLSYVKADGTMGEAIADSSLAKFASAVVMQEGLATNYTGIIRLSGKVSNVPIENGVTIAVGDKLWLSDDNSFTPYGRVTNVEPALYVQEVGIATTSGTGNAAGTNTVEILFNPGPGRAAVFITAADVTYDNLAANGDVGTGATQVAQGDHTHTQYTDIPATEIILFDKSTAVTGYTLLASVDDELVYISSGGAGGSKPGSTWTLPAHIHPTGDHTLQLTEIPAHDHSISVPPYVVTTHRGSSSSDWALAFSSPVTATGPAGGGDPHNHGNTGAASWTGGATSWRPKGRNFTRQQRN